MDLLARLDEAVLDRTSSVVDILNTCPMFGIRIGAFDSVTG
jgi:hypothetical protein